MVEVGRPFNCDLYEHEDDDGHWPILTCIRDGPQWGQIGRQLGWSGVVWLLVYVLSHLLHGPWHRGIQADPRKSPPAWVAKWVGTTFRRPHDARLEVLLEWCQLFASSTNIWLWIKKSYTLEKSTNAEFSLELACVILNVCHAFFGHVRAGFAPSACFSIPVLIDCLTLSPIILQRAASLFGGSWLTLAYLRAYQQLTAFKHLCNLGMFERFLSDFTREMIIKFLECILVVFFISGTMFVLEGLGDIEGFDDRFIDSGMGGISFFQMVYFTAMTITTVGYGDYSPTTVLSRVFIVLGTFGGVTYFSLTSVELLKIMGLEASGQGRFQPSRHPRYRMGRGHILIVGGGVTCGRAMVLETFLRALCRLGDCPEVVLLSDRECTREVKELLHQEWARDFSISFFVGCPLDDNDMERVKASEASMIIILSDFQTADIAHEDSTNLLYGLHIQRAFPEVPFRLMLVGMQGNALASQLLARQEGMYIFSMESFKAALMASSLRCPGLGTVVLNLGMPDVADPQDYAVTTLSYAVSYAEAAAASSSSRHRAQAGTGQEASAPKVSRWLREYTKGCNLEIYGFLPCEKLVGMTFCEASVSVAAEDLLLLGVQIRGVVVLNPSTRVIEQDSVLFAIADDQQSCDPVAKNGRAHVADWIDIFNENRRVGGFNERHRVSLDADSPKRRSAGARKSFSASPDAPPPLGPVSSKEAQAVVNVSEAPVQASESSGGVLNRLFRRLSSRDEDGKVEKGSAESSGELPSMEPSEPSGGLETAPRMLRTERSLTPESPPPAVTSPTAAGHRAVGSAAAHFYAAAAAEAEKKSAEAEKKSAEAAEAAELELEMVRSQGGHTVLLFVEEGPGHDPKLWSQVGLLLTILHESSQRSSPGSPGGEAGPRSVGSPGGSPGSLKRRRIRGGGGSSGEDMGPAAVVVVHNCFELAKASSSGADSVHGLETQLTQEAADRGQGLCFVRGAPLDSEVLAAAGLEKAARVLSLAPSKPPGESAAGRGDFRLDKMNLLLVRTLDRQPREH